LLYGGLKVKIVVEVRRKRLRLVVEEVRAVLVTLNKVGGVGESKLSVEV